jgi:hypothetical protein
MRITFPSNFSGSAKTALKSTNFGGDFECKAGQPRKIEHKMVQVANFMEKMCCRVPQVSILRPGFPND